MMQPLATFAGFEDALDLGHGDGVDMRPTLLRVLTDLYLQRPTHTPEDERYFTELALRLIDATDVPARSALAERLATYPSAPRPVIERLARDVIEVAKPILQRAGCLSSADLAAIAQVLGGAHAEIIAARPAATTAVPAAPARRGSGPADIPPAAAEASELSELFYAASARERRLILISLEYASITPSSPAGMQRADVRQLESAALGGNAEGVVRELERSLGISRTQARRIVNDELGEPTVVAAKALSLPADVLQRLLLFVNPRIGQSVRRVYDLAELYSEVSVEAARRLIAIWRAAERIEKRDLRAPFAWRAAAENARRALSEVSRRPELRHDARLRGGER